MGTSVENRNLRNETRGIKWRYSLPNQKKKKKKRNKNEFITSTVPTMVNREEIKKN